MSASYMRRGPDRTLGFRSYAWGPKTVCRVLRIVSDERFLRPASRPRYRGIACSDCLARVAQLDMHPSTTPVQGQPCHRGICRIDRHQFYEVRFNDEVYAMSSCIVAGVANAGLHILSVVFSRSWALPYVPSVHAPYTRRVLHRASPARGRHTHN